MLAAEVLPEDGLKSYLKGDLQPRKTVYFQEELDLHKHWHLTMTIDRKACRPVIKIRDAKPDNNTRGAPEGELFQKNYLFDLSDTDSEFMTKTIQKIASELGLVSAARQGFQQGLIALRKIFMEAQAIFLEVDVLRQRNSKIVFANSRFCFDDDAKKKARNVYLPLWEPLMEDEAELYAETFGLVYVKMNGDIGTVVNGAGLAMATNDAICVHGGKSANFLDAGGQATNDTMKRAFKIVMDDRRVKIIFVNIYGGITRCDMIAESIIDAVNSLGHQSVPMVVRLQGTNSEEGLKLLEDANLGIHVEADFDKATKKAVELAESALFLFSTLQLPYIDIDRVFCAEIPWAVPGECYWFKRPGLMRNGLFLHLVTFLPAGALVCFQFIPVLQRPKYTAFHRANGYIVLSLSGIGIITALIISKEAMGGPITNRIGTLILATTISTSLLKAIIAIRHRKIQEHRAWMLRGWFYATSIITMRIILVSFAHVIGTPSRAMTLSMSCSVIEYLHKSFPNASQTVYPSCEAYFSGENLAQEALVTTNWDLNDLPGITAALRIGYAVGGWVAFAIHSVGIEIYIRKTSPQYKVKAV
ncbi:unnamed protein product [Fusarium graminearum]|nr:unnamed protein product [Fusarium graminearum]CAG1966484.1 unnamed protein product [Fusarium graminearum]